jgi:leucyl/phenylalanyl-tRNA--protein transferase
MANEITAELVLRAYANGIFPMGDKYGTTWYSADPRFIIDIDNFHTPRRLARKYRQKVFDMKVNTAFAEVIAGCANRQHTWITPEIISVYTELHELGFVHSVEAFKDEKLAGGLYGVSIGGAFMAESMFHRVTDASKMCLVYLVERLKQQGFILLDAQFMSPETQYLQKFGGILISQTQYLEMLAKAINLPCHFNKKTP